jgi:pimeloyl-ACP methyl ester carboxylesterase
MYLMPLPFLLGTLAGLASVALLAGGVYIVWAWYVGQLVSATSLVWAGAMLLWSAFGRYAVLALYRKGDDEPGVIRGEPGRKIQAPDGSILHIETDGSPDKPIVILTHGWALNNSAWYYVRKHLSPHFRLVMWDLPGLGRSTQPADGHYTVARLAEDLRRVIDEMGKKPVTLVGHSMGGMMILTLCRLHPDLLGRKVTGIVLMNTTHTWPLKTMIGGSLMRLLRWPVLEPLLILTILFWPLIWLMNWQSYLNGSSHIVNRFTSMSSDVTRGQLEFATRLNVKHKPSVVAKGLLAMLRWDETGTPARIPVPTRVVAADADRLTLPEAAIEMAQMLPQGDVMGISPAGHLGPIEEGLQYSEAIAELVHWTESNPPAHQPEPRRLEPRDHNDRKDNGQN